MAAFPLARGVQVLSGQVCGGASSEELQSQTNTISKKEKLFKVSCLFWYVDEWEKEPAYWNDQARRTLQAALTLPLRAHRAKNIILFLGDGELLIQLNSTLFIKYN